MIRSTSWAALDSLPVDDPAYVSFDGYNLTLTGPSKVRNVFTFAAADLARAGALRLKVPDGATTLINVIDGYFQNPFAGGIFIWDDATGFVQPGNPAQNADLEARRRALLWNFPNAAAVTLGPPYAAWQGSVLAPRASVPLTYQHIFGSIAAASVSGTGEIGYNPPNPCLPDPTPCPQPSPTPTATPTVRRRATATPTRTPTPIPTVSPTPTRSRRRFRRRRRSDADADSPTPDPTPLPTVSPEPDRHADADARHQRPERAARSEAGPRRGGRRGRLGRGRHLQEGDDAARAARSSSGACTPGRSSSSGFASPTSAPISPTTSASATSSRRPDLHPRVGQA